MNEKMLSVLVARLLVSGSGFNSLLQICRWWAGLRFVSHEVRGDELQFFKCKNHFNI